MLFSCVNVCLSPRTLSVGATINAHRQVTITSSPGFFVITLHVAAERYQPLTPGFLVERERIELRSWRPSHHSEIFGESR